MLAQLIRNWWVVALRGVFAIVFGILAFLWPAIALVTLVLLFGIYALADGICAVVTAVTHKIGTQRWWGLFAGIVSIVAGILVFAWPGITAMALLYLIAAWAVVTGIFEIFAAIELRKELSHEWLLILTGILSVAFGILVTANPGAGALSIIWLISIYAVILGAMLVVLGFRLHSLSTRFPGEGTPTT
jgi:uncharacterized membrane protein HdeD (DUF308 family)